ncbi:MAG: hypothetical protein ACI9EW_000777 [Cellvibrionaceae bacterium]|jgi:hypothetical protein
MSKERFELDHMNVAEQIAELLSTQDRICATFFSIANHQDWQPKPAEWSFRYIAAHLAQVELDCHLRRMFEISAGENPHYGYYTNAGWDFSSYGIQDSISTWRERRNEMVITLRRLDEYQLAQTGIHETFGAITPVQIVRLALDHDLEHEAHLDHMMKLFKAGKGLYAYPGTVIKPEPKV